VAVRRDHRVRAAAVAAAVALLLSGCVPALGGPAPTDDPSGKDTSVSHSGPQPTAMTQDGDVEVWDLTVPPSVEAFGIDTDVAATVSTFTGAYSSSAAGGRPVRFDLPEGRAVEMQATEVIFTVTDSPEPITGGDGEVVVPQGRLFSLSVRGGAGQGTEAGVDGYRDLLAQLALPDDSAVELQQKLDSADADDPLDGSSRTGVSASLPASQGLEIGVSASFRPQDDSRRIALELAGTWEPVAIP